jgi:hypothetical protein
MKVQKEKFKLFTRTTAMVLSAILILSLSGISYAYWTDSIKIYCTISTGSWQEEAAGEVEILDKTTRNMEKIGAEGKIEEVQGDKEGIAEELGQESIENTADQDQEEVKDKVVDVGEQEAEEMEEPLEETTEGDGNIEEGVEEGEDLL